MRCYQRLPIGAMEMQASAEVVVGDPGYPVDDQLEQRKLMAQENLVAMQDPRHRVPTEDHWKPENQTEAQSQAEPKHNWSVKALLFYSLSVILPCGGVNA